MCGRRTDKENLIFNSHLPAEPKRLEFSVNLIFRIFHNIICIAIKFTSLPNLHEWNFFNSRYLQVFFLD